MKLKRHLLLGRKATTNLDSLLKSRDITLLTKILLTKYSQNCGFSSSHVWMWELDYKENWLPINWCFPTVVLEKTLESSLDYKEIKPVNPKVNPKVNFKWIFIWKTDGKAEAPLFWPPDARSRFIGKDADAGKDWRQEGITGWDGWMVSWTQWTKFEQALGDSEGQGSLAFWIPWGCKEWDTTEWLKWTERSNS